MSDATTHLMTVEEFWKLPGTGPFYYELRRGELVQVTRPNKRHFDIQRRLFLLLLGPAEEAGFVAMEWAFRALPEHELRIADVAVVSKERWEQTDDDDVLRGAPELVVEVLSPSNTASEILDKEKLCLENGSLQFWVVDPIRRQVKVSTPDGITKTYRDDQEIPLSLFPGSLAVRSLFDE